MQPGERNKVCRSSVPREESRKWQLVPEDAWIQLSAPRLSALPWWPRSGPWKPLPLSMGGHSSGPPLRLLPLLSLLFSSIQLLPFTRLSIPAFLPAPLSQQAFPLDQRQVSLPVPFPLRLPQLLLTLPEALPVQLTRQTPLLLVGATHFHMLLKWFKETFNTVGVQSGATAKKDRHWT